MSAVCPACGVAVVPGYVRCPRCHAGLPLGPGQTKRATAEPGGTAVARPRFPLSALLVALGVAVAIIVVFGVRSTSSKRESAAPAPLQSIPAVANPAPRPAVVPAAPAPVAAAPGVTPAAAVRDLEDTLHRQRLWGRAVVTGARIDVRSGSCADPAMRPVIESKTALLHDAGLTKLRCLEQSGAVVFERDL